MPTLIRLRGEQVEGWVGWKIGPVLGRTLGASRTWSVLGTLGAARLDQRRHRSPVPSGQSRRSFLRVGAGVVAGAGILLGTSRAAFASPRTTVASVTTKRELSGRALAQEVQRHLDGADSRNVLDACGLDKASRTTLQRTATTDGDEDIDVLATVLTHDNGIEQSAVMVHIHSQNRLLISQEFSTPVDGTGSVAQVFSLHSTTTDSGNNDTILRPEARSYNGAPPIPIPEGADLTAQADPCGGCNSICQVGEYELRSDCNFDANLGCILSAAGCVGCLGCSGTGACIFCAVTSCGGAIVSCCPGNNPNCRPCSRVC
ncbi:hypothetical protein FB471_5005 [Amycolatopsis cihanbeyliensis]|uniref:Uncharacterized protein n=1 Tax=Amycolatopsis cihanbeyliensis TaxID=1128664 RepID=A0A542DPZ7_AMYCI|nr:hypothetical protein FB471_5005 [Amycolatopsis cihanbeyliensis]